MSDSFPTISLKQAARFLSLAVALAGAACSKDPKEFLDSGKKYFAEQKYSEAAIQLRNAINIDPQMAEAHYQLGQVYIRLGQPRDAAQEFKTVALLDPGNLDAQVKAGNLLLLDHQFAEALEKARLVLGREPGSLHAALLLGNIQAGIVQINDSLQELRAAFEIEPTLTPAYIDLVPGTTYEAKPAEAEETFRKAAASNPESVEAQLAVANLYLHTGRKAEAETALADLLAKHPQSRDARLALAFYYIQTGKPDQAESIYAAMAAESTDVKPRIVLAQFYSEGGKLDKSADILQRVLQDDPSNAVASRRLAGIYLDQKKYDQAAAIADAALAKDADDVEARLIKGKVLLGAGRTADAVEELGKITAARPAHAAAHYYLGLAQIESRNLEAAAAELQAALANDDTFYQAYIPLAEIRLSSGKPEEAVKLARQALANPDLAQAHLVAARAYAANRDFTGAQREIDAFFESNPGHPAGLHHLGLLKLAQGADVEAEKYFDSALKADPQYSDSMASICDLYVRQNRVPKAMARLDEAIARYPSNPAFPRIQARMYLAQNDHAKAQAAFQKAVDLGPSDNNRTMELADFYIATGSIDKASALLQRLGSAKDASAVQAKKKLAEVYLSQKKYDAGLQAASEVLQANPADIDAAVLKGRTVLAQGKTAEAISQLQAAVKKDPGASAAKYYLGQAYYAAGNRQAAEVEWSEAIRNSGSFVQPQIALSQLKLEAGDADAAARFARQALAVHSGNSEAQLLLALSTGDAAEYRKAAAMLEDYLAKSPADAVQRQRLGVAYLGQKDLTRAEKEFETALKANPESKDSVVGLVRVYLERNQAQQALTRLNQEMAQNPQQGLWQLLAELYLRQKDLHGAEEVYKRAAALEPKDATARLALADFYLDTRRPANASAVYDELVKIKAPSDEAARILKGRVLMATGKAAEAAVELQSAAGAFPASPVVRYYLGVAYRLDGKLEQSEGAFSEAIGIDGRMAWAHLGLAQSKLLGGDADQAIRYADSALKINPALADAILVRGNALLAKGTLPEAAIVFQKLVQAVPGNPAALERLGSVYAAQGDLGRAETQFQESLKAKPDGVDALIGLVRIYLRQRKTDQALQRVQQQIARTSSDSGGAQLYEILGEVYTTQKNWAKAEEAYRKAISIDPSNFTAYSLLGQLFLVQNSADKAIREFENVLKVNPRSTQAHIVLAVIHESVDNAGKAKFHYREALRLDPQSPVAANNLAWILAETGESLQEAASLARLASTRLPNVPNVMDTLGWVYYKTGAYDSAVDVLKECVQRSPKNPAYHYHLGMSYFKLGDRVRAKTYLEGAVRMSAAFSGADEARSTLAALQSR